MPGKTGQVDSSYDSLTKHLAKNLRQVRGTRGFSQEGLALAADVDRTYVSQIEREVANPSLKTICQLADALMIDPVALLTLPD